MERITLKLFWIAMIACASCALLGIWFDGQLPEAVFKLMFSLFIVGLANFLIWSPLLAYRFLKQIS